jgi:hypothetical protein
VDRPTVVRTCHGTSGNLSFEGASPNLVGDDREAFLGALRRDVSACTVERAPKVFRKVAHDEPTLAPETCAPYVDANAAGFVLQNVLPLVFVKTRRGEVLPNARVAIKYLRENEHRFAGTLAKLASHSGRIFEPAAYERLRATKPRLVEDVAQPYACFSNTHMALGAGCYVMTPPGIATLLGPPTNRRSPLTVLSGLMESEWHHSELFVVFECPSFSGEVLVIEPGTVLAQFVFVAHAAQADAEVVFSQDDLGADRGYRERSIAVGLAMVRERRPFVLSELTGVKSISVSCPHCWVSVTAAAEHDALERHTFTQDFYPGYKALRGEVRRG